MSMDAFVDNWPIVLAIALAPVAIFFIFFLMTNKNQNQSVNVNGIGNVTSTRYENGTKLDHPKSGRRNI